MPDAYEEMKRRLAGGGPAVAEAPAPDATDSYAAMKARMDDAPLSEQDKIGLLKRVGNPALKSRLDDLQSQYDAISKSSDLRDPKDPLTIKARELSNKILDAQANGADTHENLAADFAQMFPGVEKKGQAREVDKALTRLEWTHYSDEILGKKMSDEERKKFILDRSFTDTAQQEMALAKKWAAQDIHENRWKYVIGAAARSFTKTVSAGFVDPGDIVSGGSYLTKEEAAAKAAAAAKEIGWTADLAIEGAGLAGAAVNMSLTGGLIGKGMKAALVSRGMSEAEAALVAARWGNSLGAGLYGGVATEGNVWDRLKGAGSNLLFMKAAGVIEAPAAKWLARMKPVQRSKFLQFTGSLAVNTTAFTGAGQIMSLLHGEGLSLSQARKDAIFGAAFWMLHPNPVGARIKADKSAEEIRAAFRDHAEKAMKAAQDAALQGQADQYERDNPIGGAPGEPVPTDAAEAPADAAPQDPTRAFQDAQSAPREDPRITRVRTMATAAIMDQIEANRPLWVKAEEMTPHELEKLRAQERVDANDIVKRMLDNMSPEDIERTVFPVQGPQPAPSKKAGIPTEARMREPEGEIPNLDVHPISEAGTPLDLYRGALGSGASPEEAAAQTLGAPGPAETPFSVGPGDIRAIPAPEEVRPLDRASSSLAAFRGALAAGKTVEEAAAAAREVHSSLPAKEGDDKLPDTGLPKNVHSQFGLDKPKVEIPPEVQDRLNEIDLDSDAAVNDRKALEAAGYDAKEIETILAGGDVQGSQKLREARNAFKAVSSRILFKEFPRLLKSNPDAANALARMYGSVATKDHKIEDWLRYISKDGALDISDLGAVLTEDNLREIKQRIRDESAAAKDRLLEAQAAKDRRGVDDATKEIAKLEKDAAAVTTLVGKDKPFENENAYRTALKNNAQAIQRFKDYVRPQLDAWYQQIKSRGEEVSESRGLETGARVNLLHVDGKTANMGPTGPSRIVTSRPGIMKRAKGTGDYNTDFRAMLEHSYDSTAYKGAWYDALDALAKSGHAVWVVPHKDSTLAIESLKKAVPIDVDSATRRRIFVEGSLSGEVLRAKRMLDDPSTRDSVGQKFRSAIILSQLVGVAEPYFHLRNIMSVVLNRPMTSGLPFWKDAAASLLFRADTIPTLFRAVKYSMGPLESYAKELAQIGDAGALRPDYMAKLNQAEKGWFDAFSSSKKNPLTFFGRVIHRVDTGQRLLLNDVFNHMVEAGIAKDTPENRRQWINQIGNYNAETFSKMGVFIRNYLNPYLSAWETRIKNDIRLAGLDPGVGATSVAQGLKLRLGMASKLMGSLLLAGLLNSLFTNNARGRKGTPLFMIDMGPQWDDKDGKPRYLSVLGDITGLEGWERLLRDTGVQRVMSNRELGIKEPAFDTIKGALTDTAASAVMNNPNRLSIVLSGKPITPLGRAKFEPEAVAPPGELQAGRRAWAAIASWNSVAHALFAQTGVVPETKGDTFGEEVLGNLFVKKGMSPKDQGAMPDRMRAGERNRYIENANATLNAIEGAAEREKEWQRLYQALKAADPHGADDFIKRVKKRR